MRTHVRYACSECYCAEMYQEDGSSWIEVTTLAKDDAPGGEVAVFVKIPESPIWRTYEDTDLVDIEDQTTIILLHILWMQGRHKRWRY